MDVKKFETNAEDFLISFGYIEPHVEIIVPKYSLFEFEDGRRRLLASFKESQKGNQMVLSEKSIELLYHAKKFGKNEESTEYVRTHQKEFDVILDTVSLFATKYSLAAKKAILIRELFEKNINEDLQYICDSFIDLMKMNEMKPSTSFNFLGTKIAETRYRSTNELLNSWIVFQSITGLYESRKWLGN